MIRKGQRIAEYTGEKIDNDEADRRYDDEKMSRHHTFLFILNSRWCVDAAVGGNIARFINHKCDPNCIAWIGGVYKPIQISSGSTTQAGTNTLFSNPTLGLRLV